MYLGKAIRLGRLFDDRSGRLLAITLDHAIARGVLPGLVDVESAVASVAAGKPDAITLQKGIATRVFSPAYSADGISLILKATSYSPFHPTLDAPTATVEEALRLGADAISVGMLVGEPNQAQQLTHLSRVASETEALGLPLAAHTYPRGQGLKGEPKSVENVQYAVRAGAEVGVDVIKTEYTSGEIGGRGRRRGVPSVPLGGANTRVGPRCSRSVGRDALGHRAPRPHPSRSRVYRIRHAADARDPGDLGQPEGRGGVDSWGGARSRFWTQMKADITGKRYRRAGEVQSASRGAATLAAVGLGAHNDVWAASATIGSPESEPVDPTTDRFVREIYDRRYRVFKGLYPALKELFGDLRDATQDREMKPYDEQDGIKASTSETGSVGAGGLGKQEK